MSAPRDARLGTVLGGRFLLEERLGQGGFGAVYRATHTATGGSVAIKVLRADHAGSDTVLQRFYREARNTHRLHHPNTVRVSDFGEADDGSMYIVMEYVAGRSLASVLEDEAPLPVARVIRIVTQILKSLGEAHALGVIHRDIKPDNIMLVDQFGEPDFVKVLDFGISRSIGSGATTTSGGFIGTPRYMAPEQWLSMPVSPRTDLYAVGIIAYQMLSGQMPFRVDDADGARGPGALAPSQNRAQNALAVMAAHCTLERTPLGAVTAGVSPALASLVGRLIESDPEARPPGAEAVLAELGAIAAGGPMPSHRPPRAAAPVSPVSETTFGAAGAAVEPGIEPLSAPRSTARALAVGLAAMIALVVGAWVWPDAPTTVEPVTAPPVAAAPPLLDRQAPSEATRRPALGSIAGAAPASPVVVAPAPALARHDTADAVRRERGAVTLSVAVRLEIDTRPAGALVRLRDVDLGCPTPTPCSVWLPDAVSERVRGGEPVILVARLGGHVPGIRPLTAADLAAARVELTLRPVPRVPVSELPAMRVP